MDSGSTCKYSERSAFMTNDAKIVNIKAVVDCKAPKRYVHDQPNTKKIEKERQQLKELEKENRCLASKIEKIQVSKGRVDSWNEHQQKSSGYFDLRNQELARISWENHIMQKKINTTKSYYDHEKQLTDYKVTRQYMARLCGTNRTRAERGKV